MPHVISRVNGLRVEIPLDARGVIHRFAVAGGGNELVFEPVTRKAFDSSKALDTQPLGLGSRDDTEVAVEETVVLTENVIDEDEGIDVEPKVKVRKPRKQPELQL